MASTFPFEIEEIILDFLAEDDEFEGHPALKTCSLVCKAFLPICRKHIFGSIVLDDEVASPSRSSPITHAFDRLLHETPEIAHYIRKLEYYYETVDLPSPSIQESLKQISRLEFLTVWQHDRYYLSWSNIPIRSALLHLLHLPTLTHLKVININGFVASDLVSCINLKYLEIGRFTTMADEHTFPATMPEHSIQLNEFIARIRTHTAVMKLCTARRPDGQPIIDFGSLSKITVTFQTHDESETSQELFRRCHSLTSVKITCKLIPSL